MMSSDDILLRAFENSAGHMANLDAVRIIVEGLAGHGHSIEDIIQSLEREMEEAEVTLRTDLRILINETQHLVRRMTSA
ncbi:MAG: hypothetical protein ACXABV_02470 [Candidatus Thorarchaeota archaeon]|jgi:hypothetical protein